MSRKKSDKKGGIVSGRVYARNKKAFHDYEILEKYEGGVVFMGSEVKSVRAGQASLKESFIQISNGEAWLWNCHIPLWKFSSDRGYDPACRRKVLLHQSQIDKLVGKLNQKGLTLVPLKLYDVKGRIKVEIGLCRGKKVYEKRQKEKERTLKKELHQKKRQYMV